MGTPLVRAPIAPRPPSLQGVLSAIRALDLGCAAPAPRTLTIASARVCDLTGARRNNGAKVTFSGKRTKHVQLPNLQKRRLYWPEGDRFVTLKVSARALKIVDKVGLNEAAKRAGVDLASLPWSKVPVPKAERGPPQHPPMPHNPHRMKNPAKLAASRKAPVVARHYMGRVVHVREDRVDELLV